MLAFTGEPELEKHETSLALLQHICQTLKPGGRAAVIIADHVLKATGPAQLVRTYLLNTCILHTVLRLPYGIFYPNKVTAHVLFFRRSQSLEEKTQQIWFYDLRHQFPIFGQYFQLRRQHLRAFEKLYGEDALGMSPRQTTDSRWHCFNREVIASQGDKLDLGSYLPPNEGQEEQFANVWELLAETVEGLEELAKMLR
jgi:type I restriction enzyme M protein